MKVNKNDIHPELQNIHMSLPIKKQKTLKSLLKVMGPLSQKSLQFYDPLHPDIINIKVGQRQLKVRVYGKTHEGPVVLWLHGGGYALGSATMVNMSFAKQLLKEDCTIFAPEYRLSTQAPFPAALQDAMMTLHYINHHYGQRMIIVGGESAGGGLALSTALYARDKTNLRIDYLLPLYPMIDARGMTESMKNNDAPVWNEALNKAAWSLYLNGVHSQYASPTLAKDVSGLPSCASFVGTIEPFYDETVLFFNRLLDAGVDAKLHVYEGCYHAFDMLRPKTKIAQEATKTLLEDFKDAVKQWY